METALPAMRTFGSATGQYSLRSNAGIAQDFLDLTFRMESGRQLSRMTRFDGPVRVRVAEGLSAQNIADLDQLIGRLQREAGLDIRRTNDATAQITIQGVPHSDLQRAVPGAACFVVPRVVGWQDFLRKKNTGAVDWSTLDQRTIASVFVPSDASPQEIRDCLHEELAQALGPLNDLYRLPDSIFNDDNINAVLTGFDMLMLRLTYAPELANGMSRQEVQSRLPALLARLNPGGSARDGIDPASPRAYHDAINRALTPGRDMDRRRAAARNAISLAQSNGLWGARLGFAYFALGRLELDHDPSAAYAAFLAADTAFRQSPETSLHVAHVALQLAAFALRSGDGAATLAFVDSAIPVASAGQNAALLASLLMFRSEALLLLNRAPEAEAARLDSLAWARYGFGSDRIVRERAAEIAALNPARRG